jgi:RNA polymerase sigma-70 factor, ECF subfamily
VTYSTGGQTSLTEAARLEALFNEHFSAVRTYTRRRAPEALVDDVVAETFLVAWRRINDLPPNTRPWLLGVARKTLSTQLRSARRRSSLVEKLKIVERNEAFSPLDRPESTGVIASLERLSAIDQEILALAAWEQLKPRDAAVVMGMSPARYRVRLHRAKRRLLRELQTSATGSTAGQPVPVPLARHEVAK